MNFLRLLFSFFGRIGRTVYWCGLVVNLLSVLTIFFIADSIFLRSGGSGSALIAKQGLLASAAVAFAVSMASLHVQRMHDRGLTGWLGLAGFLALSLCVYWIGRPLARAFPLGIYSIDDFFYSAPALCFLIFILFQFGVVRGQKGANRFGPDPLEQEAKPTS
jgi:uncharacterized membrane protein YhaH (DUF805 family)